MVVLAGCGGVSHGRVVLDGGAGLAVPHRHDHLAPWPRFGAPGFLAPVPPHSPYWTPGFGRPHAFPQFGHPPPLFVPPHSGRPHFGRPRLGAAPWSRGPAWRSWHRR